MRGWSTYHTLAQDLPAVGAARSGLLAINWLRYVHMGGGGANGSEAGREESGAVG